MEKICRERRSRGRQRFEEFDGGGVFCGDLGHRRGGFERKKKEKLPIKGFQAWVICAVCGFTGRSLCGTGRVR